ncbi:hypothetical protein THO17_29350 [Marinomonas sp. THO17]
MFLAVFLITSALKRFSIKKSVSLRKDQKNLNGLKIKHKAPIKVKFSPSFFIFSLSNLKNVRYDSTMQKSTVNPKT